jgi:hypothetical protein
LIRESTKMTISSASAAAPTIAMSTGVISLPH